jgi:hypothetical protein
MTKIPIRSLPFLITNSPSHSVRQASTMSCRLGITFATILILSQAQIASAGPVSLWANDQENGWVEMATDPGGFAVASAYTTPNGAFTLINVTGSAVNGSPNADLHLSATQIKHNMDSPDELQLAVIGTDYTAPTMAPITVISVVSGTDSDTLSSLSFQSYVDSTNNALPASLAGGQGLQIPTVFPSIGGAGASQNTTILSDLNSPFSVAELFTLHMTTFESQLNLDGDTTLSTVPEPPSAFLAASMAFFGFFFVIRLAARLPRTR